MRCVLIVLLLFIVSCQPDPTPFPVSIPATLIDTPSAQAATTDTVLSVRYALAANTAGAVPDLELIAASGQVEQLTEPVNPADLGTRYDIIAAYGDLADGERSPVVPHVSLILNTDFPPFDDSVLATTLQQALDTRAIVITLAIPGVSADESDSADVLGLRTELANMGLPDGIEINAASGYAPGIEAVRMTLRVAGIDTYWGVLAPELVQSAMRSGRVQVALVMWTESRAVWETLAGEGNIIDLFSVPISYLAVDGLTITFTPYGFPLATR